MVKLLGFDLDLLRFDVNSLSHRVPLEKSSVERFASSHGINLPCEYVQFLCVQNGGSPERSYFSMAGEWVWLRRLFHLSNDGFVGNEQSDTFSLAYHNAILGCYVPEHYTIIGSIVRDDLLVLCNDTGCVGAVAWDDVSELEDRPTTDVVLQLAKSFMGFLRLLEDYNEAGMQI